MCSLADKLIELRARPRGSRHGDAGGSEPSRDLAADRTRCAGDPRDLPGKTRGGHGATQSTKGSCTRMVSSRFGLVESSATGAPISSSSRRTYLMHCAGSSAQERAPRVDCDQPFHGLVDRHDAGLRPLRRREMIERQPVEPVAHADLELRQLIEHVELGQSDAVDAGHFARLAHEAGVEPAAAARPPRHRAELDAALADKPAGFVLELGRERPLARPAWCRPW